MHNWYIWSFVMNLGMTIKNIKNTSDFAWPVAIINSYELVFDLDIIFSPKYIFLWFKLDSMTSCKSKYKEPTGGFYTAYTISNCCYEHFNIFVMLCMSTEKIRSSCTHLLRLKHLPSCYFWPLSTQFSSINRESLSGLQTPLIYGDLIWQSDNPRM